MAHIIVFGNEKGGSGKTTTAMHTIISLLNLGFTIASIDLDNRQQSLSRYIENRRETSKAQQLDLLIPEHFKLSSPNQKENDHTSEESKKGFISLLDSMQEYDFIVIDTPGSNTEISVLAHSYADTVITPINDSFIDLDLIGKVNAENLDMISPGIYSAMFFEQKLKRAARDKKEIDWIVVRNRLSALEALNKRNVDFAVRRLSRKLGFRIAPGFGDRVIFKELFLHGLTLHDATGTSKVRVTPSVIAARQELRDFLNSLQLEKINVLANSKA